MSEPKTDLSWGLVIATKDRLEALQTCVRLALQQTWPPVEVVVADSSVDWQHNAALVGEIVAAYPDVRFVYEQGITPSLTMQRNQAVAAATADIVFMIDDDSFMHRDCATEIMQIYGADTAAAVAGVQATETREMPDVTMTGARKDNVDVTRVREASSVLRWFLRKVFMMGKTDVFIPYDGAFHLGPVPAALREMAVKPTALFGGFRMTYRRTAVLVEPFDPTLRYYCPGEDLDGSYRISRQGLLLTADHALLYHYAAQAGRLNRTQVAHLWSLNQAVLLRRHGGDQRAVRRAYRWRMAHRILSDCAKDLLMRRFGLPQTRGSWRAWRESGRVFEMSAQEIEGWYPARQQRIVRG